jgi:ribose 5-phosphate isomerase B
MNTTQSQVYIGADHGGFALKQELEKLLGERIADLGDMKQNTTDDYPLYAARVAAAIVADARAGKRSFGILICRSAEGMAMTAGKFVGIRAAVVSTPEAARRSRGHNDANIVSLPGDDLDVDTARAIVEAFLEEPVDTHERHVRRRSEIARIERLTPEIVPGIFETSPEQVAVRREALVSYEGPLHIDVGDGQFIERKAHPQPEDAFELPRGSEVHLMVKQPADYVEAWKRHGAERLVAHIESGGIEPFLAACTEHDVDPVIGIDLGTSFDAVLPYIHTAPRILVMAVKAGKSGQPFESAVLEVVAQFAAHHPAVEISIDGGVNDRTAPALVAAGASRLVSTSFLAQSKDPLAAIELLRHPRGGYGE